MGITSGVRIGPVSGFPLGSSTCVKECIKVAASLEMSPRSKTVSIATSTSALNLGLIGSHERHARQLSGKGLSGISLPNKPNSEAMEMDVMTRPGTPADGAHPSGMPSFGSFRNAHIQEMSREGPSSSISALSDHSDLSSLPGSISSKATTPIDGDSSKEAGLPPSASASLLTSAAARRRYSVRPKVSIPSDMPAQEYAMQCIAAAESSRLNPYGLHEEEYLMLRDHISHAQVTTYLNIRNGILRLWIRNCRIPVKRDEAIGCAKDARWFDVANVCYDWLVRKGYINFGCVEIKPSRKGHDGAPPLGKRKTVVVLGAGMSGLGCARQLEGLAAQYHKKFREQGEDPPRVVVLEGRNRIGGRVYSRQFRTKPKPGYSSGDKFDEKRCTAEMGGMIITGFERGNPLNVLVRGQLGLPYHELRSETTLYDSDGKPVDVHRDQLVESLFNDCLDRVSEYKFKSTSSKLIEGNREQIDEGRDSAAELTKTIRQVEETTAAQPHALSVAEQSMAPHVNLVPVSSDRATGRVHTKPGTPGALKAAYKAKLMGWALRTSAGEEDDVQLEEATKLPNATLGSVTDNAISQYRQIVDLNAQDFRLINWHIANLEYSNATNYHQLSLQGWDIDAGNEWEGKHTMITGGYQSVPRGLLHFPSTLDLRQNSAVKKITYKTDSDGLALLECEDGFKIEADYVVNTIPLGVLKHGSVHFEPELPVWKADAIKRLGFGVLNKVVLVFQQAFWDESRDIFGVLRTPPNRHSHDQEDYASQRGRFFQWFNVSRTSGLPVLIALMAGDAGYDTENTCNDDLVKEAMEVLHSVYGSAVTHPVEAVITRWSSDRFARGSYSSAGPGMKPDDYDIMARPVGNLYFAGEHTIGTHPATVHGAYLSGLRAASQVFDAMLGPIEVPSPLILPRDSSPSLKRKASETKDPAQALLEDHENKVWDHIVSEIGQSPLPHPRPPMNAYYFYSKANYEAARARCEVSRRPGKGPPSGNEVRLMIGKMWKDATVDDKRPHEAQAEEQKQEYGAAVAEHKERLAEWNKRALRVRAAYEKEHSRPQVPGLVADGTPVSGEGTNDRMERNGEDEAEVEAESDAEMETG